jgi:hypothetical protein
MCHPMTIYSFPRPTVLLIEVEASVTEIVEYHAVDQSKHSRTAISFPSQARNDLSLHLFRFDM